MLHEKPIQCRPLTDDEEGTRAWMGEKRRKNLAPSSSDAPDTAQDDHPGPISQVTDMDVIIQGQDHDLLLRPDTGQEYKDGHEEEELYGPTVDINQDELISYKKYLALNIRPTDHKGLYVYSIWEGFDKLQERLARYRITYYKVAKPESERDMKLKDPAEYSSDELRNESYFEYLENDDSFEWYFHPEAIKIIGLDDYQRFVPSSLAHDLHGSKYRSWDDYRRRYHTYDIDEDYVNYYGELSKKIKWIEGYVQLHCSSAAMFEFDRRALKQAIKLATKFPHLTVDLAVLAHHEYIWDLRWAAYHKDLHLVYFEIWKRVAKKNMSFRKAVEEVRGMDKFPLHRKSLENVLDIKNNSLERMFEAIGLKGGISVNAGEDEARDVFRKIVNNELGVALGNMATFARKKLEIAQQVGICTRFILV